MKHRLVNFLCMAFFLCLGLMAFSGNAHSQTLTMPDSASQGQKIDITYENPKLKNQAVAITLRNGNIFFRVT